MFKSPFRSELVTLAFWREVLARCGRQAGQTLLPLFAVAALAGGLQGINYAAVGVFLLGVELAVVLRAVFEIRVQDGASLEAKLLDRAAAAFVGSLLGAGGVNFTDVLNTDWSTALGLAGAAAVTSALHTYLDSLGVPVTGLGVGYSDAPTGEFERPALPRG